MTSLLTRLAQINSDGVNLPNPVEPGTGEAFVSDQLQQVLMYAFGVLGAIAVMIIVIAAFQYVISAGDSQKVAKAKDAIIYAMVGLAVAILAYSIVAFVLDGVFS